MRYLVVCFALVSSPVLAGGSKVLDVKAKNSGGAWQFDVTVEHADEGWDHYADGWEVIDANGKRLGYRKLLHPHENEQPFTRSLGGVVIDDSITEVFVRSHDSVHGWEEQPFKVTLK